MNFTLKGKISRAHPYQLDPTLTVYGAGAEAEATGKAIEAAKKIAEDHVGLQDNPHNVTKAQVGLSNVDNTSDVEKPISLLQAKAIEDAKKAGTDAQIAAENAQITADNALNAAENALTSSKEYADEKVHAEVENALSESKNYSDTKHILLEVTLTTEWKGKITVVEKTDETSGNVWKTEKESAPYTQTIKLEGSEEKPHERIFVTDCPHVVPVYSETLETALMEKESWAMVSDAETADGSITFKCFDDKPKTAIKVQIEVNR